MNKIKKFFTGAWDVTSRLLAGKATESDKALVGLTAVILCLAALAIITIEAWLPLAALAALCYLVYRKEPNNNALTMAYQDALLLNVTEAVNRIHDIFGLCYVDPREAADVLVSHSIDAVGVKRAVTVQGQ